MLLAGAACALLLLPLSPGLLLWLLWGFLLWCAAGGPVLAPVRLLPLPGVVRLLRVLGVLACCGCGAVVPLLLGLVQGFLLCGVSAGARLC